MLDSISTNDAHFAKQPVFKATTNSQSPRLPAWRNADLVERLAEAYEVIHALGGKVFTLRLDLDAQIAVTGASDPVRVMSRRIQRAFQRAGLPTPLLAFSLEVTRDVRDELHLHGAIDTRDLDLATVKTVLRSAAGYISGRSGSRQAQLKNFNLNKGGPEGWARYPTKAAARTRRVIDHHRVIYIDKHLKRLAASNWEQRRNQLL